MQAKEIKTGTVVVYNDSPIIIEQLSVQTPSARGAATLYKFRGRNLVSRQKVDITLKGGESLPDADFERRGVSIMYADATHMHLMDLENFSQYDISLDDIQEQAKYMTESLEGLLALIYNDECVGVQIPPAIEMEITYCEPGIKGNSATGRTKPATLETGLIIQVPEYLKQGETIKVDTRTNEFLSRA